MNILSEFLAAKSPAAPAHPTPALPTFVNNAGSQDNQAVVNYWANLNRILTDKNNDLTLFTAQITALQNAISSGDLAAFVSLRLPQIPQAEVFAVIQQFAAANAMATVGSTLIAAYTAEHVTPLQNRMDSFVAGYGSVLRARKLIP